MSKPETGFTTIPAHAIIAPPDVAPAILYFVESTSKRFGTYWRERGQAEAIRDQVVSDIASGQIDDATRVVAVNLAAGRASDVSVEIARDVLAQCIDHGLIGTDALAFMERHLKSEELAAAWRRAAA